MIAGLAKIVCGIVLAGGPVAGQAPPRAAPLDVPLGPDLAAGGWRELNVPGERPNSFVATAEVVTIGSAGAVSFLYRPVDAPRSMTLSWQWRVDRDIPATDLAAKGRDDRPLALHVWFPAADARRSGGLVRGVLARMLGAPEWGRALTYVWGGTLDEGARLSNPYMDGREGALIVRRTAGAPTGTWLSETVDLAADYRAAFGAEPPAPSFIALSSDTDDTNQVAEGSFAAIRFGD
ncbi:MAG: DUF3047 domain-containing protein [Rhodospirillaceae bacterium]|nr:DUF3047 domain-containing protein [Rhodospirillaceae bacterium]